MSVAITCYGGVGEIGGNKILLEDGDTRLLLDFGIAFGRQEQFFNELLRPRPARGLLDPLALGLLPPLEGLYREDLTLPGLWARFQGAPLCRNLRRDGDRPAVDAVLISHAHLDHNGDLSYLDRRIPVHTTRVSAFVARAMQVTGTGGMEREMVYFSKRLPKPTGELESPSAGDCLVRTHNFLDGPLTPEAQAFWDAHPFSASTKKKWQTAPCAHAPDKVAGLELKWWPVDHSIPGAVGLAIKTSIGWIGYTGDIRFHGKSGALTHTFARELAALEPRVLICEGTHIDSRARLRERDVVQNALPLVQGAAGRLVIADFGPRNVERLLTFLEIAAQTGRKLVIQPKDVYLLEAIALADPAQFQDPLRYANLYLYEDPKCSPRVWEAALRGRWSAQQRTVGPQEVTNAPGEHLLAWSLWDLNDLLDLENTAGGIYLYSNSRAYDDEQAADLDRLRNWVRHMGMTLFGDPDDPQAIPLHASGHASGQDLLAFVRTVQPRMLIPVHTENPTWWQSQLGATITVCIPQVGSPLNI